MLRNYLLKNARFQEKFQLANQLINIEEVTENLTMLRKKMGQVSEVSLLILETYLVPSDFKDLQRANAIVSYDSKNSAVKAETQWVIVKKGEGKTKKYALINP